MNNNINYFLALNRIPGIGPRTVAKLLKLWPDLSQMFALSAAELECHRLPIALAQAISTFDLNLIEDDLRWQQSASDHHLLSWESKDYPAQQKEISDPPIILYAQGQLSAFNAPMLAMVGSRNPSVTGAENAKYFAKELSTHGVTVVSGLALGIDARLIWAV